jgi:hypothetical protein
MWPFANYRAALEQALDELNQVRSQLEITNSQLIGSATLATERQRQIEKLESRLLTTEAARDAAIQSQLSLSAAASARVLVNQTPPTREELANLPKLTRQPTIHSQLRQLDSNLMNAAIEESKKRLLAEKAMLKPPIPGKPESIQ